VRAWIRTPVDAAERVVEDARRVLAERVASPGTRLRHASKSEVDHKEKLVLLDPLSRPGWRVDGETHEAREIIDPKPVRINTPEPVDSHICVLSRYHPATDSTGLLAAPAISLFPLAVAWKTGCRGRFR
jgi:hypothetical protein